MGYDTGPQVAIACPGITSVHWLHLRCIEAEGICFSEEHVVGPCATQGTITRILVLSWMLMDFPLQISEQQANRAFSEVIDRFADSSQQRPEVKLVIRPETTCRIHLRHFRMDVPALRWDNSVAHRGVRLQWDRCESRPREEIGTWRAARVTVEARTSQVCTSELTPICGRARRSRSGCYVRGGVPSMP